MAANLTRTISLVEIWAHPTEGGMRAVYLQYRTADAGALTTITTIDTTRLLARKKGGGATVSFNSTTGVVTTDGDYLFLPFTAAITMTDLKVWVTDSNDKYARICEVKAYREVDWTARATAVQVTQDAALRRFRARTLSCSLANTDGHLSFYGTEGGYNSEVGAGVVLRAYVGYEGTEKIPQGVFYVDKWDEDPMKAVIKVSARDGAGVMGADVRPNLKTNKTLDAVIEYLANLCGIASTDMDLDSVAQRVSYFLPEGGAAWTEAQKVAEAGSFASVYFDAYGYLVFVSHSNVPGLTGNEAALASLVRVIGSGEVVNDCVYFCGTINSGTNQQPRLLKYDIANATWSYGGAAHTGANIALTNSTVIGGIITTSSPSGLAASALITTAMPALPGYVILSFFAGAEYSTTMPSSMSSVFTEARATAASIARVGNIIYMAVGGADSGPASLWRNGPFYMEPVIGIPSDMQFWCLAIEQGRLFGLARDTLAGGLKLYEIYDSGVPTLNFYLRATFGGSEDLRPTGMTATGNGYVWINYAAATGGATGMFTKITVPGYVVTTTAGVWESENVATTTWARDSVTYADGLVVAAVQRPGTGASTERQDIVTYDENTGEIVNLGPLGLSGSLVTALRGYQWSGGTIYLGILDGLRVFEIRPGTRTVARQDSTIATIRDSDLLLGLQIGVGDMKGDKSIIVNRVSVKSNPRIAGASKTVWKAQALPWRVRANDELTHRIQLTDDVDADTLAAVATYSGAAATIYLDGTNGSKKHHRTPTIVIKVTTGGTITALSITGNELISGSLITESFGPAASLKRYRFRRMQIDNPYIYDSVAQTMIASDVLQRMSFANGPPIQISGVKVSALWHLEPLDRVTIVHEVAGINADFYVVRFTHDYRAQTTSLDLVAVPA